MLNTKRLSSNKSIIFNYIIPTSNMQFVNTIEDERPDLQDNVYIKFIEIPSLIMMKPIIK